MARVGNPRWNSVERWGATCFIIGGMLLVGHAAMSGIHAFTTLSTPPDVFVTTGHLVAIIGLFGLYPLLVSRTPTVTRVGGAVAVVAFVSWAVMTVTQFLAFTGVVESLDAVLPAIFFGIVLLSTILTYGLFGVAALRADSESRQVGLLVLAPGALTVALVLDSAITGVTPLDGLVIGGGLALAMLALGFRLRNWDVPSEGVTAVGDTPW